MRPTRKQEPTLSQRFAEMVALILALVVTMTWGGYVLTILWAWFVVPVTAWPAIGLAQGIGLAITGQMLLRPGGWVRSLAERKAAEERPADEVVPLALAKLFMAGLTPAVALGLGWLAAKFV